MRGGKNDSKRPFSSDQAIKVTSSCGARHLSRQYNDRSVAFSTASNRNGNQGNQSKQILSILQVTCSCHLLDLKKGIELRIYGLGQPAGTMQQN